MSCDKPCDSSKDCCDQKKKCIEDHCKDVDDCLSPPELQELKDGFDSDDAVGKFKDHKDRIKPFSDRTFLIKFLMKLYSHNGDRAECARMKKCILIPYDETGKSCCEGMTGHHIIPSSAIQGKSGFEDYKENKALTVCLAGESNHKGTHGYIHMKLRDGVKDLRKTNNVKEDEVCDVSYEDYSKKAMDSFMDTTNNICDRGCIESEIKDNLITNGCEKAFTGEKGEPKVKAVWGNAAAKEDNVRNVVNSHKILCYGGPST